MIYCVKTQADEEGRTTKILCYVEADSPIIAAHFCMNHNMSPFYDYRIEPIRVCNSENKRCLKYDFKIVSSSCYETIIRCDKKKREEDVLESANRKIRELLTPEELRIFMKNVKENEK
ncbi:hypothetical protein POP12_113 [Pectobacterium phage POP12]|nr:hypothetical protein POP12_113 [Pectobacterium phage POP12]